MATKGKAKPVEAEELSFYEIEANLAKLCDFLRSKEGPSVREAMQMDKRVHYLKGMCFYAGLAFLLKTQIQSSPIGRFDLVLIKIKTCI